MYSWNKHLIETNMIVSFNEMHGFYYEFQAILSANLHVFLYHSWGRIQMLYGSYAGVDYNLTLYVHSWVDSNTFTMGNAKVDFFP